MPKFSEFLFTWNLKNNVFLCRCHCKNTFCYYFIMVCTIYVQRISIVCCRRQIFEEFYTNLSFKSLNSLIFTHKLNLKSWISPSQHLFAPSGFPHPRVTPFWREGTLWGHPYSTHAQKRPFLNPQPTLVLHKLIVVILFQNTKNVKNPRISIELIHKDKSLYR